MIPSLKDEFRRHFQSEPRHLFFCPGRVNLIGEHIDYNGGKVMPCAITMGTWLAISKNRDKKLRFHSLNFPETVEFHLQGSYTRSGDEWFNYPLGVINHFTEMEMNVSGLDMVYAGNLPVGAGLSSSASIEVVTAYALNEMFGYGLTGKEISLLCKKVENQFIGVNSGIMDQFAVALGKAGHAILLNCDTLDHEYLPLDLGEYALTIINTNKPRKLVESRYNERFIECGAALKALKKELDVQHLCEVSLHQFTEKRRLINDPVLEKRALHVISENFRVGEAVDALKAGELFTFGKLMYASHKSLKEFYEVTGPELDAIVEFCLESGDCIGARMTGAGFGGCAIALVKKSGFDKFEKGISDFYTNRTGYAPGVFQTHADDGARRL